ncbi:murB [Acrasis kona]|uniref:MurB n=1 Tax=Acrasis kona TaxID=1008807 RepID=A0AAW2YRY5_9EUKA
MRKQPTVLIGKTFNILYKNYRGIVEKRKITVVSTFEGETEYHSGHQQFIKAHCHERNGIRDFAANDVIEFSFVEE